VKRHMLIAILVVVVFILTACPHTKKLSDASLAKISVGDTSLQNFNPDVNEYTVELAAGTVQVPVITVTPNVEGAVISIDNAKKLPGTTKITVTALNGRDRMFYYIHFTVQKSDDSSLSALFYNGIPVAEFEPERFDYEVVLPPEVLSPPSISGITSDSMATIEVFQAATLPGTATVIVTAEDGETTSTYSVLFVPSYRVGILCNPEAGGAAIGAGVFVHGDIVNLSISINEGYEFVDWSENGVQVSTNPTYSFTATGNRTLVANFTLKAYTLTVNVIGQGNVTRNPDKIIYNHGEIVQLAASPSEGWSFTGWGGDLSGSKNPIDITINADRNVTASFSLNSYTIAVSANPEAGGTVTGNDIYNHGETVNLAAFPNPGYSFVNWTEDGVQVSNTPDYSFTARRNRTLVANFTRKIYTLTVNVTGNGTVATVPASADNMYEKGTAVQLTPTPAVGWEFVKWVIGGVESTDVPKTVTMNADTTVEAVFEESPYTLTINVTGNGTVAAVPASADNRYEEGTTVQLIPTPAACWKFVKWVIGGVEVTDVPKTVTMNADTTVEAVFEESPYTLTINVTGNGTVATVPASDDNRYEEDTTVQLTPTPAAGWEFEKWVIGGFESTEVPKTVTMNADITVEAFFKKIVGPAP